jgi:signal peptidase
MRIASSGIFIGLLAVVCVMALPMMFGYRTLVVRSGSMTGTASIGSAVVSRPLAAEAVRVGDVVVLQRLDHGGAPLPPVMHRVIERTIDGDGRIIVRTKGDANPTADPVPYVLHGTTLTPVVVIPRLGYVIASIRTPIGWMALVELPLVLLIGLFLVRLWRSDTPAGATGSPEAVAGSAP